MIFGFFSVGPGEIAIIMVVALIIFGAERLPEIGRQIGMAYREMNRLRSDVQRALDIQEYTRFDLPDYSTSSSTTSYTYTHPALPASEESDEADAERNESRENRPAELRYGMEEPVPSSKPEESSSLTAPQIRPPEGTVVVRGSHLADAEAAEAETEGDRIHGATPTANRQTV